MLRNVWKKHGFFIDKGIRQCYDIENKVEVAYFKSTPPDVAGTEEGGRKGIYAERTSAL